MRPFSNTAGEREGGREGGREEKEVRKEGNKMSVKEREKRKKEREGYSHYTHSSHLQSHAHQLPLSPEPVHS